MKRSHLAAFSVVLLVCLWPHALFAQSALPPARTLSLFTGIFLPADEAFDAIYGSKVPVVVQLDWRLIRHLGVFGGVSHVRGEGAAIIEDTGVPAGTARSYDTSLRMTSLRAGAAFLYPRGFWELSAGAGVSVNRYREEWPTASMTSKGSQTGWLVQARVSRGLSRRAWISGGVEYGSAKVERGEASNVIPSVDLGGFQAFAGGGVRF